MNNLRDIEAIKKIDPQDTYGSTELMAKQLRSAWDEVNTLDLGPSLQSIQNIIFCGMGASIYGALVTRSLEGAAFPYPTEVITDYHLPAYVNENTLVVLTSYSGSTEEVLSCAEEAKTKNAKMVVLTKGGKLAEFAQTNHVPSYIFDGKLNPSGVPRLGNGYSILGLLGLLNKLGIVSIEEREITDAITRIEEKIPELRTKAMNDSEELVGTLPVIFAAEHLSGNAQILRNQFNETSKAFSAFYLVPDLNHHLMEGLQFPADSKLVFLTFSSPNYSAKIKKRMELTIDVVRQNKHVIKNFQTNGQSIYDDFMEMLIYGSFLTLFLGLRYDQNPAINPWVDWFKEKLATP